MTRLPLRWPLLALLLLLGVAPWLGCKDKAPPPPPPAATQTAAGGTAATAPSRLQPLPVPADFEAEAEHQITKDNYREALRELEREIAEGGH